MNPESILITVSNLKYHSVQSVRSGKKLALVAQYRNGGMRTREWLLLCVPRMQCCSESDPTGSKLTGRKLFHSHGREIIFNVWKCELDKKYKTPIKRYFTDLLLLGKLAVTLMALRKYHKKNSAYRFKYSDKEAICRNQTSQQCPSGLARR
jgi:hypothetical protein